eukprot:Sspe_Gene.15953::Locus_5580_Transcript_1_1_Confidence_1.000_Length_711::g.15953::m.15953
MRTVVSENVEVYKVVGGEQGLVEYYTAFPRGESDWSALYLQFDASHALESLGNRWDQGFEKARLVKCVIPRLEVVVAAGADFASGGMSGEEKARRVKEELGIPLDAPLMHSLGDQGKCLACLESVGQWELVVPDDLVPTLLSSEQTLMEFRPRYGATWQYREVDGDAAWSRFDDMPSYPKSSPPLSLMDPRGVHSITP